MSVGKKESTNAGVPVLLQKRRRIEGRKITLPGLPPPLVEIASVGFVAGNTVPALEYLLARVVVPRRSGIRFVNPRPVGVVARPGRSCSRVGPIDLVELEIGATRLRSNGGVPNEREEEENGDEAEKRE